MNPQANRNVILGPLGSIASTVQLTPFAMQGVQQHGLLGQGLGTLQGNSSAAQSLGFQQGFVAGLAAQTSTATIGGSFFGPGVVFAAPNEPVENTGIRSGEVTGWRAWKINAQGFLTSLSASRVWAPNEPMDTETLDGDLGIHAFKTLSRLLEFGAGNSSVLVLGQIEMWGDIIEHELGYRAQHAEIISLERLIGGPAQILRDLRRTYGLPWCSLLLPRDSRTIGPLAEDNSQNGP